MNPKNHQTFVKLFNIGVKKSEQQDVTECNRLRIHPDGVSGVLFVNDSTKDVDVRDRIGSPFAVNLEPGTFTAREVMRGVIGERGCTVRVNRKRLSDVLSGMTSDVIELHLKDTDDLLMIMGGYIDEDVKVSALICPIIDSSED